MDTTYPMTEVESPPEPGWLLQKLSPKHKTAAALLAQGVGRAVIAEVCDCTPEYITMLGRQPLFRAYIKEMSQFTEARLEALFDSSVNVMAEAMLTGSNDDKLKAAKLQLEATGRVGRFQERGREDPGNERLEQLAERLVGLLHRQREKTLNVVDGEVLPAGA